MNGFGQIALIGFGEVGQALTQALIAQGGRELIVWDTAFTDPYSRPSCALDQIAAREASSAAAAVENAELVISAVTADHSLEAAIAVSSRLRPGAFFLDLSGPPPCTRHASFDVIAWTEAHYVGAAILNSINPTRLAAPMLLWGAAAPAFLDPARATGFSGCRLP